MLEFFQNSHFKDLSGRDTTAATCKQNPVAVSSRCAAANEVSSAIQLSFHGRNLIKLLRCRKKNKTRVGLNGRRAPIVAEEPPCQALDVNK